MHVRTPVFLGLCLSVLTATSLGQPAQARREVANIRGSYFGNFISNGGDIWQTDMTLSFQSARRVGGQLNVAATIRNVTVTGTYAASNRISLTGRVGRGQRPLRIKLTGRVMPQPDQDRVTITGTYTVSGSARESGTFELVGSGNSREEF
jgi:hypothetical protein